MRTLGDDIRACRICEPKFAQTATAHKPRPVFWIDPAARILIAGQAPGARVHESGRPFTDPSGDRLRDWMGVTKAVFYDPELVAIAPMAFCFPGYNAKGSDLPPPGICAKTWRKRVLSSLTNVRVRIIIGGHAIKWHLNTRAPVSQVVADWRNHGDDTFVLPHPSWRNTSWLRKNPWFETDVIPRLQRAIAAEVKDAN